MKGLWTKKIGMTRIADDAGNFVPVTILQSVGNEVLQVKTVAADGYDAVVVGGAKRKKESLKNIGKQYKKVGEVAGADFAKGDMVGVDVFASGDNVKITGTTKGRGFAGVVKRWGFATGRNTHGSHHHREPGSVGQCSKPGRIFKGKKMPGRYGTDTYSLRSVPVVKIDAEKGLLAVKGSVPGAKNGFLFIQSA